MSALAEKIEVFWGVQARLFMTVVASIIFYAVVCWGTGFTEGDRKRLNKLVGRAGFVQPFPPAPCGSGSSRPVR